MGLSLKTSRRKVVASTKLDGGKRTFVRVEMSLRSRGLSGGTELR